LFTFVLGAIIGLTIATYEQKFTKLSRIKQLRQYNATVTTVIIVLGEMLVDGTEPSDNLKNRIHTAQEVANEPRIYHDGSISQSNNVIHVIFSGGNTAQVNKTEASVMEELWEDKGATHMIHLEDQSLSTCQNAYYSIPILRQIQQRHWPQQLHIVLVTSDYHIARAKLLFEQVFQTVLEPHNDTSIQIDDVVGAPTMDRELRKKLFLNERRWLQPKNIKTLLYQMDDLPFQLPTTARLQQAVTELDRHEKYEELN
jgi:DUF218 domain